MRIETSRFGPIEVQDDRIITMKGGMLGFPESLRYVILDHREGSPFKWLQSVDDPELAFVIIDPRYVDPGYRICLRPEEVSDIGISDPTEAISYVVINIAKDYSRITANLQGPVMINTRKRLAKQLVLYESKYSTRHVIFSKEDSSKRSNEIGEKRNGSAKEAKNP